MVSFAARNAAEALADITTDGECCIAWLVAFHANGRYVAVLAARQDTSTGALQQVMSNLSYSFGWAFAGSALAVEQLETVCDNITEIGHGKWAAQGLVPKNIAEPACNQSQSSPNATLALPWIFYCRWCLFATHLAVRVY